MKVFSAWSSRTRRNPIATRESKFLSPLGVFPESSGGSFPQLRQPMRMAYAKGAYLSAENSTAVVEQNKTKNSQAQETRKQVERTNIVYTQPCALCVLFSHVTQTLGYVSFVSFYFHFNSLIPNVVGNPKHNKSTKLLLLWLYILYCHKTLIL